MSDHSKIVTAVFHEAPAIERAFEAARKLGYRSDEINLMLSDQTRERLFSQPGISPDLAKRASTPGADSEMADELGGPAGGTVGTIAPAAAAIGAALMIPNLVLVGPVAVALAAAGAVGMAGGVLGALTHWGIPKHRVETYEQYIREGAVLIGVKPHSSEDAHRLMSDWRQCGGRLLEN